MTQPSWASDASWFGGALQVLRVGPDVLLPGQAPPDPTPPGYDKRVALIEATSGHIVVVPLVARSIAWAPDETRFAAIADQLSIATVARIPGN